MLMGLVGGSKPFLPTDLSGLVLWLRADLGITLNGGDVSGWADQSGQNNNASQGTALNQPLYVASGINGKPSVDFNGSTDWLSIASALTSANGWSMFTAQKSDSIAAQQASISVGGSSAYGFDQNVGSRTVIHKGVAYASDGSSTTNAEIWSATRSSGGTPTTSFWVNGSSQSLTNSTSNITAPGSTSYIGALTNLLYFWDGLISEVILYNRELTTAERQQVENYLKTRYAL